MSDIEISAGFGSDPLFSSDEEEPLSPEIPYPIGTSTPVSTTTRHGSIARDRPREADRSLRNVTSSVSISQSQLILEEIKKTNFRLEEFGETLKSVQQRLESVEKDLTSHGPSSSADSSLERKKKTIPARIRQEVREVYKTLLDDKENDLEGFDVKKKYSDHENQNLVKKIISEMKSIDASVPRIQVIDSVRRFFQTKLEEESLKRSGKYHKKVTQQRR